jgi:hypothetical protein
LQFMGTHFTKQSRCNRLEALLLASRLDLGQN